MNPTLVEYLKIVFPNCPFTISNLDTLEGLNMLFTDQDLIFIKDVRANEDNEYYKVLNNLERQKYIHYLKISRVSESRAITTMQVLKAMTKSPHYNNEIVKDDPHKNLIGFKEESFGTRNKGDMHYPYYLFSLFYFLKKL